MAVNNAPAFGRVPVGVSIVGNVRAYEGEVVRLLPMPDGSFTLVGFDVQVASNNTFSYVHLWNGPNGRPDGQLGSDQDNIDAPLVSPYGALLLPDGSIVVVGTEGFGTNDFPSFAVDKFTPGAGWEDYSGASQYLSFAMQKAVATTVVSQPDGKIIVGGFVSANGASDSDLAFARYNANGSVDNSFGSYGTVTRLGATNDYPLQMQLLADGKLLVLATSLMGGAAPSHAFDLLRYNADGTLDSSFGSNGVTVQAISSKPFSATGSMLVQDDGNILVFGTEGTTDQSGSHSTLFLMRYAADGALDTTFGVQGKVSVPTITNFSPEARIGEQPNGKLIVAGAWADSDFFDHSAIIRLNADGSLDTTFGNGGTAVVPGFNDLSDLKVLGDGSIVTSGYGGFELDTSTAVIVHFNADGTLDSTTNPGDPFAKEAIAQVSGPAIELSPTANVSDVDDEAQQSYAGATLTIARHGGVVAGDVFGMDGPVTLSGTSVMVNGTAVGTLASSDGSLKITFNGLPPSAAGRPIALDYIDPVLQHVTWQPGTQAAGTTLSFDWTFDDGSGATNSKVAGTSNVYIANVVDGTNNMSNTLVATAPHQVLQGHDYPDILIGSSSNDVFIGGGGADTMVGMGGGQDTAIFSGQLSAYTIQNEGPDGWFNVKVTFSNGASNTSLLSGIDRLQFDDAKVALDIDGDAGMAYRLYQAAFGRTPDLSGLGYQINALDTGMSLAQVAANFIASPEFQGKYGNVDNTQFITLLYENVLHREPDPDGLQFHLGELANNQSRADVLTHFSESPENQANVIGLIEDGILYR